MVPPPGFPPGGEGGAGDEGTVGSGTTNVGSSGGSGGGGGSSGGGTATSGTISPAAPWDPNTTATTVIPPVPAFSGLRDYFFTADGAPPIDLTFRNNAQPVDASSPPHSAANMSATPLLVTLRVDGPANEFLSGLSSSVMQFALLPGEELDLPPIQELLLQPNLKNLSADQLYDVQVSVTAAASNAPSMLLVNQSFNITRFQAVVDPNAPSANTLFLKTEADGSTTRHKNFGYHLPGGVSSGFTPVAGGSNFNFGASYSGEGVADWTFMPSGPGTWSTAVQITVGGHTLGTTLVASGTGVSPTAIGVSETGLENLLAAYIADGQHFTLIRFFGGAVA
ncbi:MAG TPA: hypothetical protein PK867_29190, partial [Pirellulales bacterium]|nr:hypothetical protein [Pirellulales bacterium]